MSDNPNKSRTKQIADRYLRGAVFLGIAGVILFAWAIGTPIANPQNVWWRAGEGFAGVGFIGGALCLAWLGFTEGFNP